MFENIYFVPPSGTKKLLSPYEKHSNAKAIPPAQAFTVSLRMAVVAEDLDGFLRGNNDILIMSRSSIGDDPKVERIHYYEEEIPKGRMLRNFFAETVFLTDDNPSERLYLELDVIEVDTDTGERKAAVQAFQSLASTAGAVFPAIVPYAFGASAAAGLLNQIVTALERDEDVVKLRFSLYPQSVGFARAPLQTGTYVALAFPTDPDGLTLDTSGLKRKGKAAGISYAVFDVIPVKQVSPDFVIYEKVAKLLTQMKQGNAHNAVATIEFLKNTLEQYQNFRQLERYLELSKKDSSQRTKEEKELMQKIGEVAELKPFLPGS